MTNFHDLELNKTPGEISKRGQALSRGSYFVHLLCTSCLRMLMHASSHARLFAARNAVQKVVNDLQRHNYDTYFLIRDMDGSSSLFVRDVSGDDRCVVLVLLIW